MWGGGPPSRAKKPADQDWACGLVSWLLGGEGLPKATCSLESGLQHTPGWAPSSEAASEATLARTSPGPASALAFMTAFAQMGTLWGEE